MTTRRQAAEAGETTYEGRPCQTCGGTERYTSSGQCVPCTKLRANANQAELRELLAAGRAAKATA